MKVKTSVTLDRAVVGAIDRLAEEYGSRSRFLEVAAQRLLDRLAKEAKNRREMAILNRRAAALNREAADVLDYQVVP